MKQIKDIKRKLKLEKWDKYYHQPRYVWSNSEFYLKYTFSEDFIREFQDKIDWRSLFLREDMEQKLINLILN